MLVNSRKVGSRPWTLCLVLLAVLALSSCKKGGQPAATNAPAGTSGEQSSAPATSTQGSKDKTKTSTTGSKASGKAAALPPEVQKLGVKPTNATDCPKNAPIKGNINNKGNKIYHDAKSKDYKPTKPEICFKDVATAKKAGFIAPKGAK